MDPFWTIAGETALHKLKIGHTAEVVSTSKPKADGSGKYYTIMRKKESYECDCPAWGFQNKKEAPENARTCKHLQAYLGEAYEDARLARMAEMRGEEGEDSFEEIVSKKIKKMTTALKPKDGNKKQKRDLDDDEDEVSLADLDPKPSKKKAKKESATNASSSSSSSTTIKKDKKRKEKAKKEENEEDDRAGDGKSPAESEKKDMALLLANKYDLEKKKPDITGYWMSEKLDGVRVFWDGEKTLYSRLGNPFSAPKWFIDKLPKGVTLDGELFHSRNNFSETVSIVRSAASQKWGEITFKVFDMPSLKKDAFEKRMIEMNDQLGGEVTGEGESRSSVIEVVKHFKCKSYDHLTQYLGEVESVGGEGVMLRKPNSLYEGKRSSTLLKVKTFFDAEAEVIKHEAGKGKYAEMTGSLKVKMANGKTFSVGSGMTDAVRANPPAVGAIIGYRFQELTKAGIPRFPTFLGERLDKTEAEDAEVPDNRKASEEEE